MMKRKFLLILIALLLLLIPSKVNATEVNENLSESSELPVFTDFSNAEFEVIPADETNTGWVALKITGIDVDTILDFQEQYTAWEGYYYYVTSDNIKPQLTFLEDGRIKSINGEENLMGYLITHAMSYNEEQDYILLYDGRFFSSVSKYN